ncbi:MAG: outer membrane protein transport protein [Sutterellaceae bacterium]|nr:outer membrane protein transport protein [Sutterellaceae bacterium]
MKTSMKIAAVAGLVAAACSSAYAGGFMLSEQSVTGLGRSYAGAGIVGDDISAVWYNPAGMTLLSGTQFQLGGVFVNLDLPLKGLNGTAAQGETDNGNKYIVPIPNLFLVHQMNEDMWFGLGITVPFGMATEYKRNSKLNAFGMNSEIKVFDINPNIAWKVNDKVSIGAGISLQYATAHFEAANKMNSDTTSDNFGSANYGRLNADGWAWGANIGVMWSPTDTLRFGLAYRSAVNHHAKGTFRLGEGSFVPGDGKNTDFSGYNATVNDARASLSAPHNISLTGTWEATESLRLSALIRWTNWASFETLEITGTYPQAPQLGTQTLKKVENHWKDSWLFTVGADYTINSAWTVRAGVGYEISPVDDDKYRTAVIPDTDRLWLSIGTTWHVNENLQGDFGFAWLHGIGDKGLYDPDSGVQYAEFDKLDAYLFGAQFTYKF